MTCLHQFFTNLFITSLTVSCRRSHNKTCTTCLIQICIEIRNPKIVCISYFLIFVFLWHTKRQSSSISCCFCLYLIYIKRWICHNIVTLAFQMMGIMIETVCFITRFDYTGKSMNRHIHKAELSIIFYLLLSIKSHTLIGLQSRLIYKITSLHKHTA